MTTLSNETDSASATRNLASKMLALADRISEFLSDKQGHIDPIKAGEMDDYERRLRILGDLFLDTSVVGYLEAEISGAEKLFASIQENTRSACRLSPIAEKLFALAQELGEFEPQARLHFSAHCRLVEYETKLLAYGNLLETSDRDGFLASELRDAEAYLALIERHVQDTDD